MFQPVRLFFCFYLAGILQCLILFRPLIKVNNTNWRVYIPSFIYLCVSNYMYKIVNLIIDQIKIKVIGISSIMAYGWEKILVKVVNPCSLDLMQLLDFKYKLIFKEHLGSEMPSFALLQCILFTHAFI